MYDPIRVVRVELGCAQSGKATGLSTIMKFHIALGGFVRLLVAWIVPYAIHSFCKNPILGLFYFVGLLVTWIVPFAIHSFYKNPILGLFCDGKRNLNSQGRN